MTHNEIKARLETMAQHKDDPERVESMRTDLFVNFITDVENDETLPNTLRANAQYALKALKVIASW